MKDRVDISELLPEDAEYVKQMVDVLKRRSKNGSHASNGAKEAGSKSELGIELRAIRQRIVKSGIPLLTEEELEKEVAERRGEHYS